MYQRREKVGASRAGRLASGVIHRGLLFAMCVLAAPGSAWAQDASAPDAGVADAGRDDARQRDANGSDARQRDANGNDVNAADVQPVDGAVPMLAVGPIAPPGEVSATTTSPGRAIASTRGAVLVTAGDVVAEINRRAPALRAAYVDPARVEELARGLVRDRVLAEAARRAGLMNDAEVKRELERVLGRVLLERALAADPGAAIDESAARAFYDAHLADYTKPEQVRVLAIVLGSRAEAASVLAQVRRVSNRRFGIIARRASIDSPSRRRDGSLGWLYPGSRPEVGLVEAAFALRVGETLAAPFELDGRFYVLRAVERRALEPVPFARARGAVASRMSAEARQRVLDVIAARATQEQGVQLRPAAPFVRVGP